MGAEKDTSTGLFESINTMKSVEIDTSMGLFDPRVMLTNLPLREEIHTRV
jgi:hypothetical protein